jgi:hypothetical protein
VRKDGAGRRGEATDRKYERCLDEDHDAWSLLIRGSPAGA